MPLWAYTPAHCDLGSLYHTEYIAIERPVEVIHRWFTPASRVEAPLCTENMSYL